MRRSWTLSACALSSLVVLGCGQLLGLDDFGPAAGAGAAGGAAGSGAGTTGGAAGSSGSGSGGASGSTTGGAAGNAGATGGSAGSGGSTGGSAGSGGSAGGQPCSSNGECDDGKACNGTETCEDQRCQTGSSVDCSGIDSTYCAGACFETASGPKCQLTARDSDGDLHGDSRCQQASGDDCDDGNDKIYTGAPELCDGLDNDCDGKSDVEELGLARAATEVDSVGRLGYLFPSVAYAHEANQFGIVWDDESDGYLRLWFARVSLDGVLLAAPEIISPPNAPPVQVGLLPQIRWGGTEYGITWTDTVGSRSELHFQRRGSDGVQRGSVLAVSPGENASFSSLVRTGDGRWLVVHGGDLGGASRELIRAVVSADGTSVAAPQLVKALPGLEQLPRLASASGVFGLTWVSGSELGGSVQWVGLDAQFGLSNEQTLTVEPMPVGFAGGPPAVASDGATFLTAYSYGSAAGGDIIVLNRGFSGAPICGPVSVATLANSVAAISPMAFAGDKYVFIYNDHNLTTSVGTQRLLAVGSDCSVLAGPVEIAAAASNGFVPSFDGGSKGFAAVWVDGAAFPPKLMLRTFGPNLCD